MPRNLLRYFMCFAVTAALAAYAGVVIHKAIAIAGCNQSGYTADTFMGYCGSDKIGDYEHAVFYHGLEPEMIEHMRQADVLFLGNSRALYAFSSQAVYDSFTARGVKYFVLAFGYGEMSDFALDMIQRYHLKPKMVVINADPFFFHWRSQQAEEAMSRNPWLYLNAYAKKMGQSLSREACPALGCIERYGSVYRSLSTGRWFWRDHIGPDRTNLFDPKKALEVDNYFPHGKSVDAGREFIANIPVDRRCIVLTGVPTPRGDFEHVAKILGDDLGVPVVTVFVPNLAATDEEHLNTDSSERWSQALMRELSPHVQDCVGR